MSADSSNTPYNPRARPRPTLSCLECKRKKLRCDRSHPCAQCVKSGITARCQFADNTDIDGYRQTSSSLTGGDDRPPSKRQRLDTLKDATNAIRDLQRRVAQLEEHHEHGHIISPSTIGNGLSRSNSAAEEQSSLEHTAKEETHQLVVKDNGRRSKLETGTKHILRTNFPQALQMLLRVARSDRELFRNVEEVQSMHKRIFKKTFQQRSNALFAKTALDRMQETLPDITTATPLLHVYYNVWPEHMRTLNAEYIERAYESLRSNTIAASSDAAADLQLLTALIALCQACMVTLSDDDRSMSIESSASATDRCQLLRQRLATMPRKQILDIETLQTHVVLLQAEEMLFHPPDVLWQSLGSVVRMALSIGLHLDVTDHAKFTESQKEERRRLWRTIVEMDSRLSKTCGLPSLAQMFDGGSRQSSEHDHYRDPDRALELLGSFNGEIQRLRAQKDDKISQMRLHIFVAHFRFEVMEATSWIYQQWSQARDHQVQETMRVLASTCGILGGNIKDMLFLAAAIPGFDEDAMRDEVRLLLTIARESLLSQGYSELATQMPAPESHELLSTPALSSFDDAFVDFFDLDGIDFDTGWSVEQLQNTGARAIRG